MPEWLSVFILFAGCSIGKLVPANVYMSGFFSSATWLILAGLILGAMITFVGLDEYIAERIQHIFNKSYSNILLGTLLIGTIFIFLMPSAMGRVLIILPILSAFTKKIGYEKGSREEEGIILIGILSTYLPAFAILPANVPNNVSPVGGGIKKFKFRDLDTHRSPFVTWMVGGVERDNDQVSATVPRP